MKSIFSLSSYQRLCALPLLLLFSCIYVQAAGPVVDSVRIGVLAKRGDERTLQRWQPTADYLSKEIPRYRFIVVPLDFVEIDQVVAKGEVEFVLANSAIYVELEKDYGAGRIATMRNRNGSRGYTVFGGVIFTRSDRKDINKLTDISGKRFAAVKENSFGGYLMAWREMARAGIIPREDTQLQFSGTHDAVVEAVLQGRADVGTVRSDTLERMSAEGKINLTDVKVINQQQHKNFGYLHSTRLYPEWPFARAAHTTEKLSHDVAAALLRMPPDSAAARSGQTKGWTVPGNYQPVHELLRELRIAPYADLGRITLTDLMRNYWYWLLLILMALLLLSAANAYVASLNRRLRHTEGELRSARDNLIDKVRERTAELEESHKRLERISRDWNDAFDAISDPIFIHDTELCIVQANPAYCECAGHSIEEMLGKPYYHFFPRLEEPLPCCVDFPEHPPTEAQELQLSSGEVFVSHSYGIRRADNTIQHAIHIMENVTAQREAEVEMQRLNRALRTLSLCNTTLVHAVDEHELMDDISHILIENGGYRYTWVGYSDEKHNGTISPVAYAGEGGKFQLALNDAVTHGGSDALALDALQRAKAVILRDLSKSEDPFQEWSEAALASGFAAAVALPLVSKGDIFGVICIFSVEVNDFDDAEIELLQEMAGDLSFGIRTLRSRAKRMQAETALQKTEEERTHFAEQLQRSLLQTIRAIALTIEKRDPYTAGHQERVAYLAVKIGEELGLDDDDLEGIKLSALIHDIGKISIPAEILSRPGALGPELFSIIKTHPRSGYDIISGIEFPWPLAEVVLQHHERMDGSGYPGGLKGDEIILEARILAVADVVEAMASHRPYRAGLGFERALEEVERGKGILYDAQVVDACVRVFSDEQGMEEWVRSTQSH